MSEGEKRDRSVNRAAVLKLVGGVYLVLGGAGAIFSAYMSYNAFEIDRRRCGALPNEYYPEIFWFGMSLPVAVLVALAGGAIIASALVQRRPISIAAALLTVVATLAVWMLLPWWWAVRTCPPAG